MKKRSISLLLAIIMLLQIVIPQNIFAGEEKSLPQEKLVKIGMINAKSYDAKVMNDLNRVVAKNRKLTPAKPGVSLFGYFEDGNEPKEEDKPKYYGNVNVNFEVKGLDGKPFQWNEIFGVDGSDNPKPARLIFTQINDDTGSEISDKILEVTSGGKYTWSDEDGNPTDLPLFGRNNEPLFYEVRVDENVSDKVQLLTASIMSSENASPTFDKPDENGLIKFHLTLGIVLQQTASTKFVSEWKTKVPENDRPQVQATMVGTDKKQRSKTVTVNLPKNDKDIRIIRDWEDRFDKDYFIPEYLYKTPDVKLAENSSKTPFTRDDIDDDTNGGDYYWKPITYNGHSYMPVFKYDVINGGKLTMTEVIPITFDPLDGVFDDYYINKKEANRTKPYKIWVEYGKSIQNRVPRSVIKDGKQFLGWSSTSTNSVPNPRSDFDNVIISRTYYPIFWSDVIEYNNYPEEASYYNSVKVHVDLTDKAKIDTNDPKAKQKRNFTVDPTHRVTLPVDAPLGKTEKDAQGRSFTWKFLYWKEVKGKDVNRKWEVNSEITRIRDNFNVETWIEAVYEKDYTSNNEQVETYITHEPKKDDAGNIINNIQLPTFDDLQKQIKIKKGDDFVALDTLTDPKEKVTVEYVKGKDSSGTEYADFDTEIYDKLQEKKNPDENGVEAPARTETIKAKLTYPDGEVKEVDIPIKVIKNIYEAKTLTERPYYVPETYKAVTLDPTTKATDPQKTYFYVNPNAKVVIPGENPTGVGANTFVKWANGTTEYKLDGKERYQFKDTTTITAEYTTDVIPADANGNKAEGTPDNFVKVTFVPTDKATDTADKIFWVNPKKEVTIPVDNPEGKDANTFKEWKIGVNADGDVYTVGTAKKFEQETTITATYVNDVIEQTDPSSKPNEIPDYYVKVTTKKTDKAKLSTDPVEKEEQIFWVNPKKVVSLPVSKPIGKDVLVGQDDPKNAKAYKWVFTEWKSNENGPRTWKENVDKGIKDKFPVETTITAQYEKDIKDQGNVSSEGLTVAESFKDGDNWINNFIPSEDTLKKAIKVKDASGTEKNVPADANVEFILGKDASGADYTDLAAELYDKLKEKDDGNNPSRVETVKAKVTFKNDEVQEVEIPIKVVKNIYEAKTEEGKPVYVPDEYVKVTVDPTTKAEKPQKYFYYVNPKAEVVIPGENPTGKDDNLFLKWTMKADSATGDGTDYTLTDRHQFTEASTITAQYSADVVPADDNGNKPEGTPSDFVKVTFVPTDKATDETKAEKIFWVNPDKAVIIPVTNPVGKTYYTFNGWKIGDVKTGETYTVGTPKQFTDKNGTTITATYTESENIIEYSPTNPKAKPEGYITVSFEADLGLKLKDVKYYFVKKNAIDTDGNPITLGSAALKKPGYDAASGYAFNGWDKPDTTPIEDKDIVVTAKAKQVSLPGKPGDEPGYRPYPEVIYRDKIVEKIVEKNVGVCPDKEMNKEIRYMQGFDGFFRPYDGLSRAEAAQILANALREDGYVYNHNFVLPYSDVGNMWYTEAVKVVTEAGVFKGDGNGLFKPTDKITRAEWIATLRRFQNLQEANGNTMNLRSGHWATSEVQAAYEAGWLDIYQNGIAKFASDEPITRQEVAAVSNKAFRRVFDKIYIDRNYKGLINYKDIDSSMALYEDILCASNTFLHDGRRYRAHGVLYKEIKFDHKTIFNIDTDDLKIIQDKFQYILR